MLKTKIWLITIHTTWWLLFLALPLLFLNGVYQSGDALNLVASSAYLIFCTSYICLFYFNNQILIPQLFFKQRYLAYGIVMVACCVLICTIQPYDRLTSYKERFPANRNENNHAYQFGPPPEAADRQTPPGHPPEFGGGHAPGGHPTEQGRPAGREGHPDIDVVSLFLFLVMTALSLAIRIIRQLQLTEKRAVKAEADKISAEADKVSAELSFLKAQINPHFLFNTLNNIYALTVIKDDNAPDSIMKLSNIMRYVTDDSVTDFVSLKDEIECIGDYIALQQLRFGPKTSVNFKVAGNIDGQRIAPLILMTFVENLFKYGVSKRERSAIDIHIQASESEIVFFCQNRIFRTNKENSRVGIGLTNIRKRLDHLYPGQHTLTIDRQAELFTVKLTLKT